MPRRKKPDLALPHFDRYFFVAAVVGVAILFFWVISPFFDTLIFAALVSIIFFPIQSWLRKKMKGRRTVPALLTTLIVMLILLAPLVLLSIFIIQESIDTLVVIQHKLNTYDFNGFSGFGDLPYVGDFLSKLIDKYELESFLAENNLDLVSTLKDAAERITSFIVGSASGLFKGVSDGMVQVFIFLITVFYFFRDGDQAIEYAKKISPLPQKYENEIEAKLKESTHAVVVGNFGTAILQGFIGAIGFAIVGIENVVLWGTLMAFASLIPYVGSTIVWVPVAISLLFAHEYWWAGFLALWGVLVIATVDNIARPFLIGGQTKMHALSTFLVVLGGILIFGLKGIVYGPLILSLTLTLIHIYEMEYQDILKR